jgi:FtsP/CotA-like multicopper oxidase with cupredoxin domain
MFERQSIRRGLPAVLLVLLASPAGAQSFRVQCPTSTITHPQADKNNAEPAYAGPTPLTCSVTNGCGGSAGNAGYLVPQASANGAIKCQQISGGDGYATMGDGTQTYLFSFGPLSGLADIAAGLPGTEFPSTFNMPWPGTTPLQPGDPATTDGPAPTDLSQFGYNGAVGLVNNNVPYVVTVLDASQPPPPLTPVDCSVVPTPAACLATIVLNSASPFVLGDSVIITGIGGGYDGTWTVSATNITNPFFPAVNAFQFNAKVTGLADQNSITNGTGPTVASTPRLDGHVDPRQIMDVGVMNGNIPAPLFAIDEDDEFFLTLTNVGMIMRPDLFEQHTVHFHGYPNASAFYDGVPDASVAINIGGSFTYYYLAPDAGTYFWHCHITPPEHLQMGMVGQLYVRPRQNRVPSSTTLYQGLAAQQNDLRTACNSSADILCSNPLPTGGDNGKPGTFDTTRVKYAYNDGDGSTAYDVEYPLQIHGFDPSFHFVGMTFNPEGFTDMKDKYFLLNGRSYPDTVTPGPMQTQSVDGANHFSQPLSSIINITAGQRALLRISSLDVSEYQTLQSLGVRMQVIGYNAKLLRDQSGNNLYYWTNSITLGGGESLDVILDTTNVPVGTYFLYTSNLDHLSNDAENFGGLMTEVHVVAAN